MHTYIYICIYKYIYIYIQIFVGKKHHSFPLVLLEALQFGSTTAWRDISICCIVSNTAVLLLEVSPGLFKLPKTNQVFLQDSGVKDGFTPTPLHVCKLPCYRCAVTTPVWVAPSHD